MESGRPGSRFASEESSPIHHETSRLVPNYSSEVTPIFQAIRGASDYLLDQQKPDGHWVAELEGDTILESEYALLLTYLGEQNSEAVATAARYIVSQQADHGGWSLHPGGPIEISASVKAYWVLKIAGYDPASEMMQRAKNAILQAGGAEQVNSFTRYYLALLGIISYRQCPAVPPELILIPRWSRLSVYDMSSWSRTILVPLSLVWAYQPQKKLDAKYQIDELFVKSPRKLSVCNDISSKVDGLSKPSRIPWNWFFRQVDSAFKLCELCRILPLRKKAIRLSASWMLERFQHSDGLGAIFPPMVWSLIAMKSLGFEEDAPEYKETREHLEGLILLGKNAAGEETLRLQPCHSPVWDTAIATLVLAESEEASCRSAIDSAGDWLRKREVRMPGDWSLKRRDVEASGWCFEYNNAYYPDVDDTAMVLMALSRSLPNDLHADWLAELVPQSEKFREARLSTLVSGRGQILQAAIEDVTRLQPTLDAFRRGVQWLLGMQSQNGGWGAFDVDNDFELLTRVPFADHNAMIDPATPDITARVLEALSMLGVHSGHESILKAVDYITSQQEPDGSWPGRWGVNYIYGTWQTLVGLVSVGISIDDERIQKGTAWLKSCQQENGGWGETPDSYEDASLKGKGVVTPSQTAWAILGLIAAGEGNSQSVQDGISYLIDHQLEDGTWEETEFTGTGFPRVFYLKYHNYRIYFPLLALSKYRHSQIHSRQRGGVES